MLRSLQLLLVTLGIGLDEIVESLRRRKIVTFILNIEFESLEIYLILTDCSVTFTN